MMDKRLEIMRCELWEQLTQKIIPFWKRLRDDSLGGYYGYMDHNGAVDKKAVKGCILNSRILWFFSNAYMLFRDKSLLDEAAHAYEFMKKHCIDREYGGVFWSVNYDGTVCEDIKHTYNQAFAIYALSSYYDASGNAEALEAANSLYELIESRCTDDKGYLESFERDFSPADNEKLSENGVIAEKTMNTLLHVFEAYTELFRVTRSAEVEQKLRYMIKLFKERVYNSELRRQEVFFDKDWNSLIDLHSYGHDIETSWLLDWGCKIIGDAALSAEVKTITSALAERIYERAYINSSVLNECENGVDNTNRIWWIQAEAVVGFFNEWEKQPEKTKYLDAAIDVWNYIKEYVVDKREFSEWFWELDGNNKPIDGRPIAEPWKCPYHNGRMCIQMISRISERG